MWRPSADWRQNLPNSVFVGPLRFAYCNRIILARNKRLDGNDMGDTRRIKRRDFMVLETCLIGLSRIVVPEASLQLCTSPATGPS